jgi:hypothetical protein
MLIIVIYLLIIAYSVSRISLFTDFNFILPLWRDKSCVLCEFLPLWRDKSCCALW